MERRIVNNRVFLIGLDDLYRTAMVKHERGELLPCARRVAGALGVAPATVPIEGYYHDDPRLAEYFALIRALQEVDRSREPEVSGLPEFRRLQEVLSALVFGSRQGQGGRLHDGPNRSGDSSDPRLVTHDPGPLSNQQWFYRQDAKSAKGYNRLLRVLRAFAVGLFEPQAGAGGWRAAYP